MLKTFIRSGRLPQANLRRIVSPDGTELQSLSQEYKDSLSGFGTSLLQYLGNRIRNHFARQDPRNFEELLLLAQPYPVNAFTPTNVDTKTARRYLIAWKLNQLLSMAGQDGQRIDSGQRIVEACSIRRMVLADRTLSAFPNDQIAVLWNTDVPTYAVLL